MGVGRRARGGHLWFRQGSYRLGGRAGGCNGAETYQAGIKAARYVGETASEHPLLVGTAVIAILGGLLGAAVGRDHRRRDWQEQVRDWRDRGLALGHAVEVAHAAQSLPESGHPADCGRGNHILNAAAEMMPACSSVSAGQNALGGRSRHCLGACGEWRGLPAASLPPWWIESLVRLIVGAASRPPASVRSSFGAGTEC